MTNPNDLSELKTFADWCRAIDRLPAEAKRTVEALQDTIELAYLLNWSPGESVSQAEAVVIESIFSVCEKLGLGNYYQEFPLRDVWDLLADEVRTDLGTDITERILLAETKLSLRDCSGYSYQLTDLRPLASLTHLTSLALNGDWKGLDRSPLSDIHVLSAFINLTELDLSGNSIANLSPLAALTKLRKLSLSRNFITDLSPLKALKNLTQLDLSGDRDHHLTELIDLSPLLALTQLKILSLPSNKLGDRALETIANLVSLENLYINDNQITDISPLVSLPNLTHLNIDNNDITDFSPLGRCRGLPRQQRQPKRRRR